MRTVVASLSRVLLAAAMLCALPIVAAAAAHADGPPSPVYCAAHREATGCIVTAADSGDPGGRPVSQSQRSTADGACTPPTGPGIPVGVDCNGCTWTSLSLTPVEAAMYPPGERVYETVCYPAHAVNMVYLPRGVSPPPQGVPAALLGAEATSKLPLPAMRTGSAPGAAGRAFAMTFVNMPTFLWVDNAAWHAYSATANDGVKAVTATATPSSVTWNMGDGGTTRCAGPGVAWRPGIEQSYCSYTYTRSSAHQPQVGADVNDRPYQVTATVAYQVTWTCAGQCGGANAGSVGLVDGPPSRTPLVVGEIQTVVTG